MKDFAARGAVGAAKLLLCAVTWACSNVRAVPAAQHGAMRMHPGRAAQGAHWEATTRSPQPVSSTGSASAEIRCGRRDAGLERVAERWARRVARGLPPLDGARLTLALRSEGSPYLWPRVWAAQTSDPAPIQQRIEQWLEAFDGDGERRCGMAAESTRQGGTAWTAVALRAKADLEDLPTRVRTGAWVDVRAKLLVKAWEAKVIVLGPTGAPRAVPTGLNQGSVRAGFIADRPGVWLVQVLSTLERGPEPVLEALVYVGMDAPGDLEFQRAPGETLTHADGPADLKWLIDAARGSEGLPVLARDPALDRVAQRHAEAMCSRRRLGHEIDGFGPLDRVEAAGLALRSTGENVAHAASLEGAHRALWSSPSHRLNLLYAGYDAVGLGIAPDPDGSVWVCELFGKR